MSKPNDMRIVHLVDALDAAPMLARWFVGEWTPWYGTDGLGDAAAARQFRSAWSRSTAQARCSVRPRSGPHWRAMGGTETLRGAATAYCRDLGDA